MAEGDEHKSFWQEVQLNYPDGFSFKQVLDQNTIRRLENGDEELLAQMRKNYEESQASKVNATMATECTNFLEDEASDIEDSSASTSLGETTSTSCNNACWSREATELLIHLYEEYEEKMEDPRKKKKDIWKLITQGLKNGGFEFSQTKVEGKWRSLIASHKTLRDNKTKTGQKRKTFQHFERIDAILAKRHDVHPLLLSGSDVNTSTATVTKFSTKVDHSLLESKEEENDFKGDTDSSTSDKERVASETSPENSRKSTSASACRRREKRKFASTSESGCYKICELPLHILKKIFEFVQRDDLNCKLFLVCKKFRNVVYLTRTKIIIHIETLTIDCGMKLMPDLEKVTIIGLSGGQKTSNIQPIINLFDVNFQKLESLVLKGFFLKNNFFQLLSSLSHVELRVLKFVLCDYRTVGELKCILEILPTLRYCDVACNLETVLDYHVFAEIANELVGQVNLNLNTLEMVPSRLLRHKRAEYRAKWPTGQLFVRLDLLHFTRF
ncbi:uncharacterized protein LOC125676862 isoform X2 [Ostrea edulis]|uniref:uncharacterized protein LOC125676862 isoform X2 n=1 Tax=Ostrea edulis TaxID=37623 RepID=UPI0020946862|nr:uncharacterized protein LOC125676862 isoform X2 [Ostrea edulis]